MSYQNLEKAMELANECKFYTTVGGKSSEEISKSEELLGIKFSKQCILFYEKVGYLSFFGNEIFGISPDDQSGLLEGNSVAYALNDREQYNLPTKWIPFYNYEDGHMAYFDYSLLNSDGEPRIIMGIYAGDRYEIVEVVADDFGNFLLQLVEEQLSNQ
ncbi:MAG: SMI1/KNR4 family protein [Oscillospiraceae bacterium]|nr:SMI1/KNR4 family protein [Oscillospiraceae bacterium]